MIDKDNIEVIDVSKDMINLFINKGISEEFKKIR